MKKIILIVSSLLLICSVTDAKTKPKGILTIEPLATLKLIHYRYDIQANNDLHVGEFKNSQAPGVGLQCNYLNQRKFLGAAIAYRECKDIKTGFLYSIKPVIPGDPAIPEEIFVKLRQQEIGLHLYYNLHIPRYFDLRIGPEIKKIKHQFISEKILMGDGKIKDSRTFRDKYQTGPLYDWGMRASVNVDIRSFNISLNVGVSKMNRKLFDEIQKGRAISTTLDVSIGYKIFN